MTPAVYDRLYTEAKTLMSQGKPNDLLPEMVPAGGGAKVAISATNFMTNYSPESIAVSTTNVRLVPVPTLIIRVDSDPQVSTTLAQWLLGNATAAGSQVPNAKFILVHDPTGKAGHFLVGLAGPVWDVTYGWLQSLKLG